MPSSGYGSGLFELWRHGLRDRLAGRHARANARWGHLLPPEGEGRLLWVHAGATEWSVRLGAELLGAIRERRYDLRLVLTFEQDYPQALAQRLQGLRKAGYGYGPCDAARAVRRSFDRLDPFALVCVDEVPPGLLREANRRGIHVLAFNTPPPVQAGEVEASYPRDAVQAAAWQTNGGCTELAAPADPIAQLVEAQVEPTFRSLVCGGRELGLAWVHLPDAGELAELYAAWRESHLAGDTVLFVSLDADNGIAPSQLSKLAASRELPWSRISAWSREAMAPGSLVWVDEPRWYPALAVSCEFIHLASAPRAVLWQALAGGVPVSFRAIDAIPALSGTVPVGSGASDENGLLEDADHRAMLARWAACHAEPTGFRRNGDATRRRFWEERRRGAQVLEELLQRVYRW